MKVLISGGGTAGHVYPALAVAQELTARHHDVVYAGATDGQEAKLVPEAGYRFVPVRMMSAQTRLSARSVRSGVLALRGARSLRPIVAGVDAVIGAGGFASAPAVLAARWVRRPLILIDQNSVPGAVNRLAARWARVVATTFDATAARLPAGARVVRTGNPIRPQIAAVRSKRAALASEALTEFGLEEGRATVVVLGGSLGALRIDEAIAASLGPLGTRSELQLLVSTGRDHIGVLERAIRQGDPLLVRAFPFIERMDLALAVADLAVSRSGAGIAELAACGVPSILVPYPHATENHQEANAKELEEAGAATTIADGDLSPPRLCGAILELIDDPDRRLVMSAAALAWARPDAAQRIADLVESVAA